MNNLYKALEETYSERILGDISEENHDFTPEFEERAERLIRKYPSGAEHLRIIGTVVRYAVIAALIALLTVSACAVGVEIVRSFMRWTDPTHYYLEEEFSDGTVRKRSGVLLTMPEEPPEGD